MRKLMVVGLLCLTALQFTGCAAMENSIAKNGSLIGSTKADYIVINSSGDLILDVYKLKDAYVGSESSSDGWNFIDNSGNVVMLGGDVKVLRVNDSATWDTYQEYHYDEIFMGELKNGNDINKR